MKSNSKNRFIVLMLAIVMAFSMVVGVVLFASSTTAQANVSVSTNDFWLESGARIRLNDGYQTNGIGYTFQIKASAYKDYNTKYGSNIKYGILIAPKEYNLTKDTVFGENAQYDWAVKDANGKWQYTDKGKTRIANFEASIMAEGTAIVGGQSVAVNYFYGSMINLKTENITKEFQGVAYIGYSDDGVKYEYLFADSNDNVRSMAYIAQLAVLDNNVGCLEDDEKTTLQTDYLDKITSVVSNLTIENYFKQADGSYVLDVWPS